MSRVSRKGRAVNREATDLEASAAAASQVSESSDPELDILMRRAARVSHVALLVPGMIVGEKYRIESQLGCGGMGAVYRAAHVVSQKPVALKCMLRSASDERARARFIREARAAARIDHPNVVNVYDMGQEDDYCYLVMELLHGAPLSARLQQGRLEVAEALALLIPAMRGVTAIHRAGVLHRDLKPDNIFLCEGPDGVQREAKVLDFGVSALAADEQESLTLTADGTILGTPTYMSPEQLQSSRDLDERSDLYSFGVILYETLSGKPPFENTSSSRLVLDVVHGAPKSLREHRPELPVALERVVLRALEKRREDRYQTIDSLIDALTPFAAVASVGNAREVSVITATARPARRLAVGLVVCALIAAALVYWQSSTPSPHAAPVLVVPVPTEPFVAAKPEPTPAAPEVVAQPIQLVPIPEAPSEVTQHPEPKRPVKNAPRPRARNRNDCELGYTIDASGRKLYRPECLL
ncbi:MAG: hypothetical protein RL701_1943 [Pseudomonadota bacterium]